jgi:hypothetical protein
MSNFKLNEEQYKLINEGLEHLFYIAKDDGDDEKMQAVIDLGKHLEIQRLKYEKEHQQMLDMIATCYYDVMDKKPTLEEVTEIAPQIKEELEYEAQQWGWDDTEIGDRIWNWINENVKHGS